VSGTPEEARARLAALRDRIVALDGELIALLAERVRLAREVGQAKRAAGLPTLDPEREAAVLRRAAETARREGLAEEDVREVFWHIIGTSRRAQNEGAGA
jgi:chorismate mutase/prephenate dehydrogenase